ncbi:MAG TPA: IucA/IucC family C-terminal-domain containing protein [Acidimicrobiia bacterium]|nr:IucA/IucC family C-terminal-domain containing protein [Acidimicrobiia bacterium]
MNASAVTPLCLEDTLQGLGPATDRLVPAAGAEHGATPAERFLLDPLVLRRVVRAFGRAVGTDEMGVAASLFCQAWAVGVTRAAIACLVGARRVPDLAAANTLILFDGASRPTGAGLMSRRFAAVAGDDEAGADPGAAIVVDDDALFAWTRARLFDAHRGPLVEALHDLVPIGRRLLWGNVAAAVAGGFAALTALAERPFDPEHVLPEAARLLDAPVSPTAGLAELFPVPHDGATRLFVRRQTCCLRYRLPDAPPTCLSCRLLPEPERHRRIRARLETLGD